MKETDKIIGNLIGDQSACRRLDLADEASDALRGTADVELSGVSEQLEKHEAGTVRTITILNEHGAQLLGRPVGAYITIEAAPTEGDKKRQAALAALTAAQLRRVLPQQKPLSSLLVVGLGNDSATPDALGPQVVARTTATRHLLRTVPQTSDGELISVCAVTPGVLGNTGIETAEIIKALAKLVQPDAVIAVDSLASTGLRRVGTTLQLSGTGLSPGGGVGNKRPLVCEQEIGVPVVALGVPTVVDCAAIIGEALACFYERTRSQPNEEDLRAVRDSLLDGIKGSLIVTPKDIDRLIDEMSLILAAAIAIAVHPGVNENNFFDFIS